jgi:hypothetical protein
MNRLRNLEAMIDALPPWAQIAVAVALVAFSLASIYGRINPKFGGKIFSRVPEEEIQTNVWHIVRYTLIPVIVTATYLVLLWGDVTQTPQDAAPPPAAAAQP